METNYIEQYRGESDDSKGPGDYRLVLKIKNGRIARAIEAAGYSSVNAFCVAHKLQPSQIGELINMKERPMTQSGEWRIVAQKLADALNVNPVDLWTDFQRNAILEKSSFSVDIEESVAIGFGREVQTPEELAMVGETVATIQELLDDILDSKVKMVICRRFGFSNPDGRGDSYTEIAKSYNCSTERIRQIEKKGLVWLRNNHRARQKLKDCMDGSDQVILPAIPRNIKKEPAPRKGGRRAYAMCAVKDFFRGRPKTCFTIAELKVLLREKISESTVPVVVAKLIKSGFLSKCNRKKKSTFGKMLMTYKLSDDHIDDGGES